MARIILEDMKLNRNRKEVIHNKDVFSSVPPPTSKKEDKNTDDINESKLKIYQENINKDKKNKQKKPKFNSEQKSKIFRKYIYILFIISLLIGGFYLIGNVFQKANIKITSKHEIISYESKTFIASKGLNSNYINFEIMIIPDNKKSLSVMLNESKEVSFYANGSITLYNEFSTKPEKLSAGTFVSDNEGKTYKINSTISIPGYKKEDNKIIPGEKVVNITSFLPGDVYNGSPLEFKINSFKNTSKYNKIYGKLSTPLAGGASGLVYVLDDISKEKINTMVNTSFKEDLLKQVQSLIPPGYILYPDAFTLSYEIESGFLYKEPEAKVEVNMTMSVVLLKENSLVDNIIKISLPNIKEDELKEINLLNLDRLSFSFVDKEQSITKDIDSIPFSLTGDIDVIWNPDIHLLKTKLLGIHKDQVQAIFEQDPGITHALVKILPSWQEYIPNNLSKINITID